MTDSNEDVKSKVEIVYRLMKAHLKIRHLELQEMEFRRQKVLENFFRGASQENQFAYKVLEILWDVETKQVVIYQ